MSGTRRNSEAVVVRIVCVRKKGQRIGRNPKTGEVVPISTRRVTVFKPSPVLCFSPISAPDGKDALRQFKMVKERSDEYVKDYAAQFIIGLREMHHICLFLFDTKDLNSRKETLELTRRLIREAAAEGYGEYRTHNALMDDVMATFNWGDGALHKFHETLKDALDPNSIMAPGKSGIWGKRFHGRNL